MEDTITVEATYDAPVSKVWKAFTDDKEMKKWYFDIPGFNPEKDFEFQFTGGTKEHTYLHLCKILEVIPEKKLAHTWRYKGYEGNTVVTIQLFSEGNKTGIKLTHEGLESFPDNPDFAKNNFVNGWNEIIKTNLKKYLESKS